MTTTPDTTDADLEPRFAMLTERTRFGAETGAGIMAGRCAFTSRDMANDWPDAFTYAIVLGWHDDEDPSDSALREVAAKFEWDDELIAFLQDCHERFKMLKTNREETR